MTFRSLGEILQTLGAQGTMVGLGEDTAATVSLRPKKAEAEAPAVLRETPPAKEAHASRWEYTATKAGAPHSEAVYCHLVVIEGGLATEGRRSPVARPSAATREGTGGRTVLKLVHAAPRSMID